MDAEQNAKRHDVARVDDNPGASSFGKLARSLATSGWSENARAEVSDSRKKEADGPAKSEDLAAAIMGLVAENITCETPAVYLLNVARIRPVATSQSLIFLSRLPVAKVDGEHPEQRQKELGD